MQTSSSSAVVLAVLVFAGCTSVLGLESGSADADGDGIADAEDNCRTDPNPLQRDSDDNGLGDVCDCATTGIDTDHDGTDDACDDCVGPGPTGTDLGGDGIDDGCEPCPMGTGVDQDGDLVDDVCDPCMLGPQHDEDGDGIADACDNCPTVANVDQHETDGDVLGDACDLAGVTATMTQLDGLASQDRSIWPGTVPGWTWELDGVISSVPSQRLSTFRVPLQFQADTMVSMPEAGESVGIHLGGIWTLTCSIDDTRMLNLDLTTTRSFTTQVGPVPGTGPIHLRMLAASNTACEALDAEGNVLVEASTSDELKGGRIGLVGGARARFEYLWAVSGR